MSYYTEFYTNKLTLRKDTPENVIQFLKKAFDDYVDFEDIELFNLQDNSLFFKDDREKDSDNFRNFYIFYGEELSKNYFMYRNGYWRLKIHRELNKCYGYREENFAEWINQYIAGHKKQNYIGWYTSEDNLEQTHLRFDNINLIKQTVR